MYFFIKNLTNGLVADIKLQTDERADGWKTCPCKAFFLLRKEPLIFDIDIDHNVKNRYGTVVNIYTSRFSFKLSPFLRKYIMYRIISLTNFNAQFFIH